MKMHRLSYIRCVEWSAISLVTLLLFRHSPASASWPAHGLQHARLPCPSPTPGTYSNSCPSQWWCHPTILPSVIPFSHLQSFRPSGFLSVTQFFASGGQSIEVSDSASVLPMNIQDWFPLGLTGLISLKSKKKKQSSLIHMFSFCSRPIFLFIYI